MAQIVQPEIVQAGTRPHMLPNFLETNEMPFVLPARENVRIALYRSYGV